MMRSHKSTGQQSVCGVIFAFVVATLPGRSLYYLPYPHIGEKKFKKKKNSSGKLIVNTKRLKILPSLLGFLGNTSVLLLNHSLVSIDT